MAIIVSRLMKLSRAKLVGMIVELSESTKSLIAENAALKEQLNDALSKQNK